MWHQYQALWDTGATIGMVTKTVFDACNLQPSGHRLDSVTGIGGTEKDVDTYLIDIDFGNGLVFHSVVVAVRWPQENEPDDIRFTRNTDVLIGMNIIAQGDFIVTNRNGGTQFYFRTPSSPDIGAFVEQAEYASVQQRTRQNTLNLEARNRNRRKRKK